MAKKDEQSVSRVLLILFLSVLVLVVSFVFLVPKIQESRQIWQDLRTLRGRLAKLTQKVADLESLDVNELESKVQRVIAAVPTEEDVPRFLYTMRKLSEEAGVSLRAVQVAEGGLSGGEKRVASPSAQQGLPAVALIFIMEGESEKLKTLVDRIEATLPLVQMQRWALRESERTDWDTDMSLSTYFLNLPKVLPEAEAPVAFLDASEEEIYQELVARERTEAEEVLPLSPSGRENPFRL